MAFTRDQGGATARRPYGWEKRLGKKKMVRFRRRKLTPKELLNYVWWQLHDLKTWLDWTGSPDNANRLECWELKQGEVPTMTNLDGRQACEAVEEWLTSVNPMSVDEQEWGIL